MARVCTLERVLVNDVGNTGPSWFQAGGSSIYIGYVVEHDDADEVKCCVAGSKNTAGIVGIAGCPSYHDSTAAFTAGKRVPVWLLGCGAHVYVTHDANATYTLKKGDMLLNSSATAGLVDHVDLFTGGGYQKMLIGRAVWSTSITSGAEKNIRINLGL